MPICVKTQRRKSRTGIDSGAHKNGLVWGYQLKIHPIKWSHSHQRLEWEKRDNNSRAPSGHLRPWQCVSHKGGRHHQHENQYTKQEEQLGLFVRPVIHGAENGYTRRQKCGRPTADIADEPAIVDIAHDAFNGLEGYVGTAV